MPAADRPVRDLVYDIGLHEGEDTAFYLAKGYRVVAFEANPDLVRACHERFDGAIADRRLTIVAGAITDSHEREVTFFQHSKLTVWGTTEPDWAERNEWIGESREITVPAVSIPEQLERHGVPHYLKIDIEGADLLCLEALAEAPAVPVYASIEADMESMAAVRGELDLLERLGFDAFVPVQQGAIPGTEVSSRALDGTEFRHRFEPNASGPFGEDLGGWGSRAQTEERFRHIHTRYRRFGPRSAIGHFGPGRHLIHLAGRAIGVPLPGWYDTHARRSGAAG